MFGKPNYIPEEFLSATNQGWVDNRTGEILVCVKNLDKKIEAAEEQKNNPRITDVEMQAPIYYAPQIPKEVQEYEARPEPKEGSNDALLDLFSTPNVIKVTMDREFEIPVVIETVVEPEPAAKSIDIKESDIKILAEQLANKIINEQEPIYSNRYGDFIAPLEPDHELIKESAPEQPVKRGRGRPKKEPQPLPEGYVKRGRGRPKKKVE